jgi:hypothetical protein
MTLSRAARAFPSLLVSLCTLALAGATGGASAQTDDPVAGLPSGPKDLLIELSDDPAVILEIAGVARTNDEWTAHLSGLSTDMTDDQVAMLADYLALNMPAEASGADIAAVAASLPADGRELFAANCFSCHGVVAYYLLQDRDVAGWMDIFGAPYHRRLLTGDNERETFAGYAAHAMPIPEEAVPEAWREGQ